MEIEKFCNDILGIKISKEQIEFIKKMEGKVCISVHRRFGKNSLNQLIKNESNKRNK